MGLGVVSLLVLVVVAIVAIPILMRVLGEATRRNPNRPEGEGDETLHRDPNDQSGAGRD